MFAKLRLPLALVLLSFLLAGCGSSITVIGGWRHPDNTQRFKKVLILALGDRALYRRLIEDEFTRRFEGSGSQAVPSYTLVGGDDAPEPDELRAAIEGKGYDAVLVTHLVDTKYKREHHEGPSTSRTYVSSHMGWGHWGGMGMGMGMSPYYGNFGAYYSVVFDYTHLPGYYTEERSYNLETALYELKEEELIWAVNTRTVDPDKVQDTIDDLADAVFEDMHKNNLP